MMAQILGFLPPTWEIRMEFWPPAFGLVRHQPADESHLSLSLSITLLNKSSQPKRIIPAVNDDVDRPESYRPGKAVTSQQWGRAFHELSDYTNNRISFCGQSRDYFCKNITLFLFVWILTSLHVTMCSALLNNTEAYHSSPWIYATITKPHLKKTTAPNNIENTSGPVYLLAPHQRL